MEDLHVSSEMWVESHKGAYAARLDEELIADLGSLITPGSFTLVDANVARIYAKQFGNSLNSPTIQIIEATETNKSIVNIIPVIEAMVEAGAKRGQVLTAIGGGVIQDIACFISSVLFRGVPWRFVPTTLLAQADSCIGSKSSVNLGKFKNTLGTFNPPIEVIVAPGFLKSLSEVEILSGIGEILKVHAIKGKDAFDRLSADYEFLLSSEDTLRRYIWDALLIKKHYIEKDEFDQNIRNIFNYGHSFGHAIESATDYGVPHGIAVTMGMDIANHVAMQRNTTSADSYHRMTTVLKKNYARYASTDISCERMIAALQRDKKNTATQLTLILPHGDDAKIEKCTVDLDNAFHTQLSVALEDIRQ